MELRIMIETPRGATEKYVWDETANALILKRILPLGMVFPVNFGFIPDTLAEDGDAIDVIVISEFTHPPASWVQARLIGAFLGTQDKQGKRVRNDRFVVVPALSLVFGNVSEFRDLHKPYCNAVKQFLETYNPSVNFTIDQVIGANTAARAIKKAWKEYEDRS